ncbi:MAG: hypothetical protein ABIQ31_11110 [Ferruginibacter sp.]
MKKILLSSLLLCILQIGFAQYGTPDPSFGDAGIVKTDIGSKLNYPVIGREVFLQPDGSMFFVVESNGTTRITKKNADGSTDGTFANSGFSSSVGIYAAHAVRQTTGKIVIGGSILNSDAFSNPVDFAVARFNTDGTIDSSFGVNGIQITDFGQRDIPYAIAVQSDNKILLTGGNQRESGSVSELIRYTADGSLDNSFNGTGILSFDLFTNATSVAVQNDGKILLAGNTDELYTIVRFNDDGSIDSSFNGGNVLTPISDNGGVVTSNTTDYKIALLAIQGNGKILIGGSDGTLNNNNKIALASYNLDGSTDSSFGTNGLQLTDFSSGIEFLTSLAVQPNGKIIIAGYTGNNTVANFAVARYNTNGTPDAGFSTDGIQITDFGFKDYANSIAAQSNGKLVALGYTVNGANTSLAAARYNIDGSLDNTFDGDGLLIDSIRAGSTFYTSTAVQTDGKVLAAGYAWNGIDYDFALARYNLNGSLDNNFSGDGKQTTDFGLSDDRANAIAIQSDGKILIAGNSASKFALARFNTDGSPDNTFSNDGKQSTDFGVAEVIKALAIQSDGKILAGGVSGVARYNSNGGLDSSFSVNGRLALAFAGNDMVLQNDKIIVVGGSNQEDIIIARFNADATPDATFGEFGGEQYIEDFSDFKITVKAAIASDGKIVLGGSYEKTFGGVQSYFVIARLNSDGTPDLTLNGGQLLTAGFPNVAHANSIVVQPDNKIILGGNYYNVSGYDFAMIRFNTDGSADNTFGTNGKVITQVGGGNDGINGMAISGSNLYVAGYGQDPGNSGVVAKYLIGPCPPADAVFVTAANGNWNDPATWVGQIVPGISAKVTVLHNVTITTNTTVYSLKVETANGNLVVNTGVNLTITH